MKLWIDNTGLQSAGCSLEERARGEVDIQGLLQLGTYLVFAENIKVNGFEAEESIAARTREIRDILTSLEVPSEILEISLETEKTYAYACKNAAEDLAERLKYGFQPNEQEVLGLEPVDLPPRISKAQVAFLDLALKSPTEEEIAFAQKNALKKRASGAIEYMLAISSNLRREIQNKVGLFDQWSDQDNYRLNAFMRYYLNHSLAEQNDARYAPAIARAELVRRTNFSILSRLSAGIDEVVEQLRGVPLEAPSITSALVQRSKGDPLGFVKEAMIMREKASSLRKYLTKRLSRIDPDSSEGQFEIDKEIRDIANDLRAELSLSPSPEVGEAVEVSFVLGIPAPSLQGSKLKEWINARWGKRKMAVLSEISKLAAFPIREEEYFAKLESSCYGR